MNLFKYVIATNLNINFNIRLLTNQYNFYSLYALKSEGKTILLTGHNHMDLEELCDCMYILDNGTLVEFDAEWSFAFNTDIRHEPLGVRYLVFYELRGL